MPFTAYDAAVDSIKRARDLLAASRAGTQVRIRGRRILIPAPRGPVRSDMRRLSIVMAVAALDTYMHRLILERAYEHQELPGGLAKLTVQFEQLLAQADEAKEAARADPHNSRPRVAVKRLLRDRLLRETFQSSEEVSRALAMVGQRRVWDAIATNLTTPAPKEEVRARLDEIVMRRNQIVHEGDYRRLERPQNARCNAITRANAEADIDFIADLIDAIHAVVISPRRSKS
jgi:RiboL-PSP-HEPN